jgi:hypothetical protein
MSAARGGRALDDDDDELLYRKAADTPSASSSKQKHAPASFTPARPLAPRWLDEPPVAGSIAAAPDDTAAGGDVRARASSHRAKEGCVRGG